MAEDMDVPPRDDGSNDRRGASDEGGPRARGAVRAIAAALNLGQWPKVRALDGPVRALLAREHYRQHRDFYAIPTVALGATKVRSGPSRLSQPRQPEDEPHRR